VTKKKVVHLKWRLHRQNFGAKATAMAVVVALDWHCFVQNMAHGTQNNAIQHNGTQHNT
jgi:hypothetical protein